MKWIVKKRYFAIMLMIILLLLFYKSDWLGRILYPVEYQDHIRISANEYKVDPLLVAAMIRVESKFRPDMTSHKGAVGLMQVMPDTANWLLQRQGYTASEVYDLEQPDFNIDLGVSYLQFLLRLFEGDKAKSIAAYNAGQGNVERWLVNGVWDGRYETVENIPYGETRRYVKKVFYYYAKYQDLYAEEDWAQPTGGPQLK